MQLSVVALFAAVLVAAPSVLAASFTITNSDLTFANVPASVNVGDTFTFNIPGHTAVAASPGTCNVLSDLTGQMDTRNGANSYTFTTPGSYYFICTVPGHCAAGMTATVTVNAAAGGGASSSSTDNGGAATSSTSAPAATTSAPATTSAAASTSAPAASSKAASSSAASSSPAAATTSSKSPAMPTAVANVAAVAAAGVAAVVAAAL
ncbi:hypothetical protein DFJ73DRAFT_857952 [Zopfochytrium polystomum]|nr:hypothetical protein DFJ73DRAFT_857952 [Zopfochytrium polystomum]